jgi:hypothetical protein
MNLACPGCGAGGLVDWKSLKNGIGCPNCGCQFLIGKNGRVTTQSELPQARYHCPRCRQSGSIPSMLAVRGTHCSGCKLALVLGPDGRLYGERDAEEKWLVAGGVRRRPAWDRLTARFRSLNSSGRWTIATASVVSLGAILICVGITLAGLFDSSPESLARKFAYTCLAGEWDRASEFFDEEDAVQQASFDRWRMIHFSSILDNHRPEGDAVAVTSQVIHQQGQVQLLLVTMKSKFFGVRTLVQQWRNDRETWTFDARATLAHNLQAAPFPQSKTQSLPSKRK